jgi:hypothetical protein
MGFPSILVWMAGRSHIAQAEALFARFANRQGLTYDVETGVPMEVCWTFPRQPKLSMPLTLGLQNGDELNFGVSDFWSYFFPFEAVAGKYSFATARLEDPLSRRRVPASDPFQACAVRDEPLSGRGMKTRRGLGQRRDSHCPMVVSSN